MRVAAGGAWPAGVGVGGTEVAAGRGVGVALVNWLGLGLRGLVGWTGMNNIFGLG